MGGPATPVSRTPFPRVLYSEVGRGVQGVMQRSLVSSFIKTTVSISEICQSHFQRVLLISLLIVVEVRQRAVRALRLAPRDREQDQIPARTP